MSTEADGLEARISELESTIETMRAERDDTPRVGRRRLLGLAAAAIGGGVAAPLLLSQTASANNSDAVIIGAINQTASDGNALVTLLGQGKDSSGNYTQFRVKHFDSLLPPAGFSNAPLWGLGAPNGDGVFGWADGGGANGVVGGANNGTAVLGLSNTGYDFLGAGSGRVAQLLMNQDGHPSYFGSNVLYEQIRDNSGAMYQNINFNGDQWAPVLYGGFGVGIYEHVITTQPTLSNSDGVAWTGLGGVHVTFITPYRCRALCTANADLWTATAGYNQDIAVFWNPGASILPTNLVAWKESGGFAGTFSPNAAFVQGITSQTLASNTQYTFGLFWKTNKTASGVTIYAGAGPISGNFSPTRLVVQLLPV